MKKRTIINFISIMTTITVFVVHSGLSIPSFAFAQQLLDLPDPGQMVSLSPDFAPPVLKGLKLFPEDPLRFDFLIDTGQDGLAGDELTGECAKLIKYFLAALTVPENDVWVNLSPYEKDRIIPDGFGTTEMGRDLLAQDYLLKQLISSLIFPDEKIGKSFWDKVYSRAREVYGTADIPVNTFNKVWIIPDKAVIYENGDTAFVADSHLKVMLEGDYLALEKNRENKQFGIDQLTSEDVEKVSDVSSSVVRDVLLPEIEKEVNEGTTFVRLRQIFQAMILATWFKQNLKEGLLSKVYVDQNKTLGVNVEDISIKEKIYQQYLTAFKKGVFNYIKEEYDPESQEMIPRKYFSGGLGFTDLAMLAGDGDDRSVQRGDITGTEFSQEFRSSSAGRVVAASAFLRGVEGAGTGPSEADDQEIPPEVLQSHIRILISTGQNQRLQQTLRLIAAVVLDRSDLLEAPSLLDETDIRAAMGKLDVFDLTKARDMVQRTAAEGEFFPVLSQLSELVGPSSAGRELQNLDPLSRLSEVPVDFSMTHMRGEAVFQQMAQWALPGTKVYERPSRIIGRSKFDLPESLQGKTMGVQAEIIAVIDENLIKAVREVNAESQEAEDPASLERDFMETYLVTYDSNGKIRKIYFVDHMRDAYALDKITGEAKDLADSRISALERLLAAVPSEPAEELPQSQFLRESFRHILIPLGAQGQEPGVLGRDPVFQNLFGQVQESLAQPPAGDFLRLPDPNIGYETYQDAITGEISAEEEVVTHLVQMLIMGEREKIFEPASARDQRMHLREYDGPKTRRRDGGCCDV